jgi:Flp pilus assembly protein CpaB
MAAGKKRSGRLLIIIILIIAVGAVLLYLVLTGNNGLTGTPANQSEPTATPYTDMVDIVVASQTIARGTVITSDVLTTIKYPASQMPQGTFFATIDEVVGQKAKYDISPAVPLTINMVIAEDGGSLASFDIPVGMTAFAIPVTPETNVAFAPQKGDHVMVIGCMLLADIDTQTQSRLPNSATTTYAPGTIVEGVGVTTSTIINPSAVGSLALTGRYELDPSTNQFVYLVASETQRPRLVCQTIIQDAAILKVGMFSAEGMTAAASPTATPAVDGSIPAVTSSNYSGSVTLIVTPQDTLVLNYLLLSGTKISLALRSSSDNAVITTDPVTFQYVMEQKNIPAPNKMPYGVEPRVDSLVYPGFNDYILIQP